MHQTFKTVLLSIVVGVAGFVFVATLARAVWGPADSELSVPSSAIVAASTSSPPIRLLIPTLNIDSEIQRVGRTAKGNMGVPNNYTDVGWYREGPAPGDLGSAVMDGHVDNGLSLPGVFKQLNTIKTGDEIIVVAEDGSSNTFIVTELQLYPYKEAPVNLIFNRMDKKRLNLITCEGTWVAGEKTYEKRLVVFAELR